jgi:hypothetical protein
MEIHMNTIEVKKDRHNRADFDRLRSVLACASKDSTRRAITRVLVEKDEEGVTVIATDGRRLRTDRFNLEFDVGLYDIKICSGKSVFLSESAEEGGFPNHRQVIPSSDSEHAYALRGSGKQFVLWATAALGCWLDPKLVELGEDEEMSLFIQRDTPALSPVLLVNDTTTLVIMPIQVDQPWVREVEAIRSTIERQAIQEETARAA